MVVVTGFATRVVVTVAAVAEMQLQALDNRTGSGAIERISTLGIVWTVTGVETVDGDSLGSESLGKHRDAMWVGTVAGGMVGKTVSVGMIVSEPEIVLQANGVSSQAHKRR